MSVIDLNIENKIREQIFVKINNEFKKDKLLKVTTGFTYYEFKYQTGYFQEKEREEHFAKIKNFVLNMNSFSLVELLISDIYKTNFIYQSIFNNLNKEETVATLNMIAKQLKNKDKLKDLVINSELLKNTNVIDVLWDNPNILEKFIRKKKLIEEIQTWELLVKHTSDTKKANAFKYLYKYVDKEVTEERALSFKNLEEMYLSKIQRLLLEKSKTKLVVKPRNINEINSFINKNEQKFIEFDIRLDNNDLGLMGFESLEKYLSGNILRKNVQNSYGTFDIKLQPTFLLMNIKLFHTTNNMNCVDAIEIYCKKIIISLLNEAEKNKKMLSDDYSSPDNLRSFLDKTLSTEVLMQTISEQRESELSKRILVEKKNENSQPKKKI